MITARSVSSHLGSDVAVGLLLVPMARAVRQATPTVVQNAQSRYGGFSYSSTERGCFSGRGLLPASLSIDPCCLRKGRHA